MTRFGVLADIHGNLPALLAILDAVRRKGVDRWIVAGDLVGYGAFPNECIETVREAEAVCVAGNHELMALGKLSARGAIASARASAEWTAERLSDDARRYLDALEERAVVDDVVVAHGSLASPTEYVTRPDQARAQLTRARMEHPEVRVLVLGHTHLPWTWSVARGGSRSARLPRRERGRDPVLVNPGAVGQARTLRVMPTAAVVDTDAHRIQFVFATYDVEAYKRSLQSAGLSLEGYRYVRSPSRAALRAGRRVLLGY